MFVNLCRRIGWEAPAAEDTHEPLGNTLIPGARVRYLAEIAEQGRSTNAEVERLAALAATAQHYDGAAAALADDDAGLAQTLRDRRDEALGALGPEARTLLL